MGDTTIYLSQPNSATTVCFLMLAKHLLFTLLILSFLFSHQAQHKVFRCSREIYRESAIPYLPRWTHKRKIVHGKNMGKFGGSIKVRLCVLMIILTVYSNFSIRILRKEGGKFHTRFTGPTQRFTGTLLYHTCQNGNRETLNL